MVKSRAEQSGRTRARAASKRRRDGQPTGNAVGAAVRAAAARAVHSVTIEGRSLTVAMAAAMTDVAPRDQALFQELCYGTLRLMPRFDALLSILLNRPLRSADSILRALLAVGLYQLTATRIPPHAAVAATVEATRILGRPRAAVLVNAALRRFQRESADLLATVGTDMADPSLFPAWLVQRLKAAWPAHWRDIIAVSNEHPPMTLRVNRMAATRERLSEELAEAGVGAALPPAPGFAVTLDRAIPTQSLPGFAEGRVSVQDAAAQFAAELLAPRPGDRVLDACAAPGNKTAHLLEVANGELDLLAVDADAERLDPLRRNLARLRLTADVLCADARQASPDWPFAPYDRILLDAPCSATGVIRRHPDIKYLRRDQDIAALAETQDAILAALWRCLRPGGRLLYATCSILPDENERRVAAFLAGQGDARVVPIAIPGGIDREVGVQLLPTSGGPDGFFYALLERRA